MTFLRTPIELGILVVAIGALVAGVFVSRVLRKSK